MERIASILPRFFAGLEAAGRTTTDDVGDLVEVCEEVVAIREQLRASPPMRPWILTARTVSTAVDQLLQVMWKFVSALGARTPIEAQRKAEDAQRTLDNSLPAITELGRLLGRWSEVSDAVDMSNLLAATANDVFVELEADGLVELDTAGRQEYARVTGREPAVGTGAILLTSKLSISVLGDEDRFNKAIARADSLLQSGRQAFQDALSRPEVLRELRNAWMQMADQFAAANGAAADAVNQRQTIRSTLAAVHALFEGPGRRFGLLFLELVGKGAFEAGLTEDGAGRLALIQQDRRLRHIFYGFDKGLRIAHAHQTFLIEGGNLVLREQGGQERSVSAGQLLDHLLAGLESLTAVGSALLVAANEIGVELVGLDYVDALGLSNQDVAGMLLGFAGATDVCLLESDAGPVVELTCPELRLGHIAVLEQLFPAVSRVRVSVRRSDRSDREDWSVDLSLLRAYRVVDDGLGKEIAFIEAMARMTRDGEPAMTDAMIRHWIAGQAFVAAGNGYPAGMRDLRLLLGMTGEHAWPDLATAVRQVMRYLRVAATEGLAADLSDITALQPFILSEPPELPFSGRPTTDAQG